MARAGFGGNAAPKGRSGERPRSFLREILVLAALFAGATAWWMYYSGSDAVLDPETQRAQAKQFMSAGKLAEAEQSLTRLRERYPDDLEAQRLYVELTSKSGRLPEAIDAARAALQLKADDDRLRERLANWLFSTGRYDEAYVECEHCLMQRPRDPQLLFLQAEVCRCLGDSAQAEKLVDLVLSLQPQSPPALTLRGALYLDAGQPQSAVPLLQAALAQGAESSRRARTRHYLSQALLKTGRDAEAKQVLADVQLQQTVEEWVKYGRSESAAYQIGLAESLLRTGKATEAIGLLEKVVAASPENAAAHRLLARHFEAQGQSAKAEEHRRRAGD